MEGTQPEIVLLPSICVSVFKLSRDRNFGRFDFGRQSLPVLLFFFQIGPGSLYVLEMYGRHSDPVEAPGHGGSKLPRPFRFGSDL